jgi:hypothetical protein
MFQIFYRYYLRTLQLQHYYHSLDKTAGKVFRDGAAVPYEGWRTLLGYPLKLVCADTASFELLGLYRKV